MVRVGPTSEDSTVEVPSRVADEATFRILTVNAVKGSKRSDGRSTGLELKDAALAGITAPIGSSVQVAGGVADQATETMRVCIAEVDIPIELQSYRKSTTGVRPGVACSPPGLH